MESKSKDKKSPNNVGGWIALIVICLFALGIANDQWRMMKNRRAAQESRKLTPEKEKAWDAYFEAEKRLYEEQGLIDDPPSDGEMEAVERSYWRDR